MNREIHRGGGHFVMCDGELHRTTVVVPCCGNFKPQTYVSSRCFCKDPDFLAHGFDFTLLDKYAVEA